jgi:hypothetical protein
VVRAGACARPAFDLRRYGFRFAQWTNAGNVLPSIVGSGFSTRLTPGPAPFGITNENPAETNFAFGRLRSKLIVTEVEAGKRMADPKGHGPPDPAAFPLQIGTLLGTTMAIADPSGQHPFAARGLM